MSDKKYIITESQKKEMSEKKKTLMIILNILIILLLAAILIYAFIEIKAIKILLNEGDAIGFACRICEEKNLDLIKNISLFR